MSDESKRGKSGVVVSIVEEAGKIRLIMDDVLRDSDTSPLQWETVELYTHRDFPKDEFLACDLSDDDLAQIGFALTCRLATRKSLRRKPPR